jgi:hypothetical protein
MIPTDESSETRSLSLDFDLRHPPEKRPSRRVAGEDPMSWNARIRRFHRWLSIAFTAAVIVAFVALAQEKPVVWMSYLPLPPLFLLWLTGMYLFVLPYVAKGRRAERTAS